MYLPSDDKSFRMGKMIFHEKVREWIIASNAHESFKISDQTWVRDVRNKSNAKLASRLGIDHSP